jgi:hypothetical protein
MHCVRPTPGPLDDPASPPPRHPAALPHPPANPRKDIFSAGCVIGELLLDGRALFDLGQLLAYRRGDAVAATAALLEGGQDPLLSRLAAHMIQLRPGGRERAARGGGKGAWLGWGSHGRAAGSPPAAPRHAAPPLPQRAEPPPPPPPPAAPAAAHQAQRRR